MLALCGDITREKCRRITVAQKPLWFTKGIVGVDYKNDFSIINCKLKRKVKL